jgi:hypothetical protein
VPWRRVILGGVSKSNLSTRKSRTPSIFISPNPEVLPTTLRINMGPGNWLQLELRFTDTDLLAWEVQAMLKIEAVVVNIMELQPKLS